MAQESLKDESELLNPTTASSSSSSPSPPPPPSPASPPPPTRQDASTTSPSQPPPTPPQLSSTPSSPPSPLFLKHPEETPQQSQQDELSSDAPQLRELNYSRGGDGGSVHRCSSCKKRVGLTGFRCRCGDVFCWRHRYSDAHDCSFDYKAAGRAEISKANPLIRAAKIIKI